MLNHNIKIKLPKKMCTAIHLADLQVPFHDRRLWKFVKKFIKEIQPTYIINHGDWAECHHWTSFDDLVTLHKPDYMKDWSADGEIDLVRETWDELHKASPKSIFLYTLGNHEVRVYKTKVRKDRDSVTAKDNFVNVFGADEYFSEIVDWGYGIKIGHLWCTHGDTTSMYAARKMLEIWGGCVAYGHVHKMQFWATNPRGDNMKAAWGIPCMCRLDPHYTSQPNWSSGIAFSKFMPSGSFNFQLLPIINYKMVFGEKTYKG